MFSRILKRIKASVPDSRADQQRFEELHLFIGEVRNLVNDQREESEKRNTELTSNIKELSDLISLGIEKFDEEISRIRKITTVNFDHTFELRRQLIETRKTKEYQELFSIDQPLVTVRIPTWNNKKLLIERAIASVQAQSYENWEIIVVGDGCDDGSQEAIEGLKDERISFYNFPYRNVYPENAHDRWQVAGSPGMNKGAELARGTWIAPLDDDDEFSPDHISNLLTKALRDHDEFVYGAIKQIRLATNEEKVLFAYPPQLNLTAAQSGMYPKLLSFFEWETQSWIINEPGDWNFIRRMMDSGVKFGQIDEIVTTMYSADPGSK